MSEQGHRRSFLRYLKSHPIPRWMFFSLLIGLVSGLGAAAFFVVLVAVVFRPVACFAAGAAGDLVVSGVVFGVLDTNYLLTKSIFKKEHDV